MTEIMIVVFTIGVFAVDIVAAMLCYLGLEVLANKGKAWFLPFAGGHVLMLLVTVFLTYVPGRFGLEFSLFDPELGLVYKNGALYQNIGLAFLAQCVAYIIIIAKDLWAVLRKKKKLNGKLLLLCIIYAVIMGAATVYMIGDQLN